MTELIRRSKMQKDYGKYFGSLLMFGCAAFALYRWQQTHLIFFLLLVLRGLAAGYFFLKRSPAEAKSGPLMTVVAYVSAAMPLAYLSPTVGDASLILASNLLAILGFLIVALATIELGTSIGVSPAKRVYVSSGIYGWLRHPMYVGYVVSETGLILINPLNLVLCLVSWTLYTVRSVKENELFKVLPLAALRR